MTKQLVNVQNGASGNSSGGMLSAYASDLSGVFPTVAAAAPGAPLASNLFDKKELKPETLRPHRCRLLGFGPPRVWSADVRYLRVANAVSTRSILVAERSEITQVSGLRMML